MAWLRPLVAILLVLLVAGESCGWARAVADEVKISCCCGSHAARHACKCGACPINIRRHKRTLPNSLWRDSADCRADGSSGQILVVVASFIAPPTIARSTIATRRNAPDISDLYTIPAPKPPTPPPRS